jgi:heterodisulfide reductase subunit A2
MTDATTNNDNSNESRVGVYVCHCGGNISNTVDIEKVVAAALQMPGVAFAQRNLFMCSDPGQDLIIEDIKNSRVNRVVVAACAPSLHETTFRSALLRAGLNPYLYVHANIREQVSFVHAGEEATEKAIAMVAAAVAKAREILPLQATSVQVIDHATVVGGGVAGLKAALDLAGRGLKVALVEKSPFLGGRTANLDKLFPTGENAGDILSELAKKVLGHPGINVHTCAEVVSQEGYIGNFNLKVERRPPSSEEEKLRIEAARNQGQSDYLPFTGIFPSEPPHTIEKIEFTSGAIVIATGFSLYAPKKGEYGFKEFPEIITLLDLVRLLSEDKQKGDYLEIRGRKIKSVAMVHCVGSRQVPGIHEPDEKGKLNENCSRTCCTGLLYASVDIKTRHPETAIFHVYRDIRTYGKGHEEIYKRASELDARFIRFKVENSPRVKKNEGDGYALSVMVRDSLLNDEELEVPVDLVVLATGMKPGEIDSLIDLLKIHCGADGFLLEVHPKLRPVEVFTAGIYLAGTCQAPMDVNEATAAASAAASKVSIILSRGKVELEPFVATVDQKKCASCLTCVRTCPFDVPVILESGAYINPAACYGCGACVSVCPGDAISLAHFDNREINAQVEGAIDIGRRKTTWKNSIPGS